MDDPGSAVMDPPASAPAVVEDDGLGPNGSDTNLTPEPPEPETPPTPAANLGSDDDEGPAEEIELFLLGNRELGLKVAGRKPDSAVLKFKGGKVDLGGQFDRGDRVTTVDIWQVVGDGDLDAIDTNTGTVKSTKKTQQALLCSTASLGAWLASKLEDHPELLAAVKPLLGVEDED